MYVSDDTLGGGAIALLIMAAVAVAAWIANASEGDQQESQQESNERR